MRRIRDRVRERIRDTDDKRPSFDVIEVDMAIADAYLVLQARIPRPRLYTASAFTISAGGDEFNLPTAAVTGWTGGDGQAEYGGDVSIRLRSQARFLRRRTIEELDGLREGETTIALGIPRDFALWEESDGTVRGRVHPGAKAAESCDLFRALMADDLRDYVGSGTEGMEQVEVQFSRTAGQALVLYAASDLLLRMTTEDLALRRMDRGAARFWLAEAQRMIYQDAARAHDLSDVGRVQRWVG